MADEQVSEQVPSAQLNEPVDFADLNAPPDDLDAVPETPKPKSETPQAAAAAATPAAAVSHPQALADAALEAGLSKATIAKLDSEALYDVLVTHHRKLAEAAARQPQRQDEPPPRQQVTDPYEAELIQAQEDGMAPTLIAAQRRMMNELKELKAQNEQHLKAEQERRKAEIFDAADEAMESLGKSLGVELTPQQKNRLFLAASIAAHDSGRIVKRKITAAGLELDLAKKPKTPPAPNGDSKKPTAADFERASLNQPTASLPSRAKGDRAAALAIRDKMIAEGLTRNANRDELEGVPD